MTLADALRQGGRQLRTAVGMSRLMPALVISLASLAVGAWLTRLGWGSGPTWVLAAWLTVCCSLAIGLWRMGKFRSAMSAPEIARRLESGGDWRRGSLTTLLAPLAEGTSVALHERAAEVEAAAVIQSAEGALAADLSAERHRIRRLSVLVGFGFLALVLARPLSGRSAMIWQPWRALAALSDPVQLIAESPIVNRGERVSFTIIAFGQRDAVLSVRAPGEPWRDRVVPLDGSGRAVVETDPLEAELVARVRSGGRRSDEVRVQVRLPAFLGSFTVTAEYPNYLSLEAELLPVGSDTLIVPEGTRLVLEGRATTPLVLAELVSESDTTRLTVDEQSFRGEVVPVGTTGYRMVIVPEQGGSLQGTPPELTIRVVADSAPTVTLPVPGQDTTAPASHRLPVVVAIEDDHGIRGAVLEARRNSAVSPSRLRLQLAEEPGDRALLSIALDLDSLGLQPGDTLRYRAIATDNAPRPRVGRSVEYMVVVPTLAEERAARGEATAQTGDAFDSLAALARRAQQQSDELARERQRGDRSGASDPQQPDPLSSEAARRAEQAAESQEEVNRQLDEMRKQLDELQQAAERGETPDTALARELAEIRQLIDDAMSPELKEAMERLREGLEELDASDTKEALSDLAEQQQRMRDAIERARELFERAKSETELANLAEEAKELLARQEAAAEQLATDSAAGALTEEELADRADSLAAAIEDAAERAPSEQTSEGLQNAAQQAREAAAEMRKAANSARRGRRQQAGQEAKAAGEALKPLENRIREERDEMQEEMRQEVLGALDRLLLETAGTLERQHVVADALRRGAVAGRIRAEQSMLEEGAAKLLQQVIAVAGKNALVSPTIAVALAGARDGMRMAIEATSSAAPSLGLAADRAGEAVDMLAVAVYALLRSQQDVAESDSGSGMEEAMQQMQQMAGQQGELSDQGKSMLQQGDPGSAEMMQMAVDQRAIAQQLERLRAEGEMSAAGELAQEAKDLARSLELGRLTPETIDRQQRLFRRMLDAGRSLEGEEEDESKERESDAAEAAEAARPDLLDPALLGGAEFPLPSWEELQRLSPDNRRRVLDYFRRLAERRVP